MRHYAIALVILAILAAPAGAQDSQGRAGAKSYVLPHTEIVDLPTSSNGIDYQLYIHVPPACRAEGTTCPVVYMLDAEYSFALSAQIVTHLTDRERIPPLISVAIGYPDKSQYRQFRTRDYTPFFHPTGGYGEEMQKLSGGGPKFLEVITSEIVPYVENHYPASRDERTLVGHSYGGLFAVYAWINAPESFENYVIVSPSLWYADRRPLKDAAAACDSAPFKPRRDLFLVVGEYEEQPENGRAMVSDLEALDALLRDCAERDVSTYFRIFADETHASIFPAALSTGLRKHFQ